MNRKEFYKAVDTVGLAAAYGMVFGRPEWGEGLTKWVPEYMRAGVVNWVLFGECYGDFLASVVKGDLFGAVRYGDDTNQTRLHHYCMFFWNYAPADCFGTAKKASAWADRGGCLKEE